MQLLFSFNQPILGTKAMRSLKRFLVISVALIFSWGCYQYVPTESGIVPPGSEVRARLTDAGREEMRQYYGPGVEDVRGALVRWDQDGLGIMTELTLTRPGFPSTIMVDTLELLPQHVAGVDIREFDGKQSLWFTAGVVGGMAGAVLLARAVGGSSGDEGGGEGDPTDPDAAILYRVPLLSIPFKIGFGFR